MKNIVLNLLDFSSIAEIHNHLSKAMNFPEYYGYNLDALYDTLSSLGSKTQLTIKGLKKIDGVYSKDVARLIRVMYNAMEENSNFSFRVEN